ncbi:heterogeneous nuclear ribonucleoprotein R-like [Sinocyclocheilus rhinocerous]|uniref:heterogeneous nuclear ribonucleoprotein R-like n=1 Tax=Sinocyclocheilus rhinocerous TaxID=307959 RepID=UPI0007B7F87A|nr:PREDICTED: heterogeneous nuclear ribonucleoprotein R-like [Sinocyclocheilus rhinocerous]
MTGFAFEGNCDCLEAAKNDNGFNELKKQNEEKDKKIASLEYRVADLEQYTRMNGIVVSGLEIRPRSYARAVTAMDCRELTDPDMNSVEQQMLERMRSAAVLRPPGGADAAVGSSHSPLLYFRVPIRIPHKGTFCPIVCSVVSTDNYQTLLDAGLPQKVAESLDNIFQTGETDRLDPSNRHALCSDWLQNKSAFLCGVMKTYRQREKQGNKVQESTKGPDEAKIKALLERTGYTLDVTTGQRKYGGPPPEEVFSGPQPGIGTEVFVGKIPRDLYEDELVPLFEKAGSIWDLRLMMDPLTGQNRGYAFITFCSKEAAQEAVKLCDNYEIRSGKYLGVCISVANNRLFVGSIPKNKTRESILEDFGKVTGEVSAAGVCTEYRHMSVTEELLENTFSQFGKLERVKKLKDYAFVHFEERDAAVKAMQEMNGKQLGGEQIEIVLAKPPDKKRKERQAARQTSRSSGYDEYYYYPPPRMPPPGRGRGRGGRGGYAYPPDYYGYEEYYDDYYGYDYHDYRGGYDDPYYAYDDGYSMRGRGSGRSRGAPPPPRARSAPPTRGRGGYSPRGGAPMGGGRGRGGGRGGPFQAPRGRGIRGARGNRGGNVGGKRKADVFNQPDSKRRQTNQQNWGSQPIAQQPLGSDYAAGYGYSNDSLEFSQDSYGQQWK